MLKFSDTTSLNDLNPAQIFVGSNSGTPIFADLAADTLRSYVDIPGGD